MSRASLLAIATLALAVAACGERPAANPREAPSGSPPSEAPSGSSAGKARFPTIRRVEPTRAGPGTYDFAVTISSPYDSPERYADGWRVRAPDGTVLGEHELSHDHADEQPFTRTQTGVEVPSGVRKVTVQARDLKNGYGGRPVEVTLPE